MGVHGLAPFLLKTCPNVIKTLPDRLRSLRGSRLVIDGTLLTQRLHFAPMPHRYRHVLGWYRIAKELQESDIRAVCVFDGRERNMAKQVEVERRRRVRRVTAARGVFEVERLKRLQSMASLSSEWSMLEASAREEALVSIQALLMDWKPPSADYRLPRFEEECYANNTPVLRVSASSADVDALSLTSHAGMPISSSQDLDAAPFSHFLEDISFVDATGTSEEYPLLDGDPVRAVSDTLPPLDQLSPNDREFTRLDDFIDGLAVSESYQISRTPNLKESFTSTLMAQYIQYQQSIPRLESLPNPPLPSTRTADGSESRDEYVMSKNQQQLTVDEGRFWDDLSHCGTSEEAQTVMYTAIMSLVHKSLLLSQSYQRRTNPPTLETYEESKEILRVMGIPCIETSGPFEAEALASSMVLHGLADYVVSEDSDVIIYEAPLIRNLTSRREPLVLISGAEVRSGLHLDRAGFVDFALLLGTDFSQRIKNIGPQRALKFIREHGSIERVLEKERQYAPRVAPEQYLTEVARARSVFEHLPPAPDLAAPEPLHVDGEEVNAILHRYNLQREISDEWELSGALAGNLFQDDPSAS